MSYKVHKSSASKPFSSLNREYRSASELRSYDVKGTWATKSEIPKAGTWKKACSSVGQICSADRTGEDCRVRFHVDVRKMKREERFSRLNDEFRGKSTMVNSSASDE